MLNKFGLGFIQNILCQVNMCSVRLCQIKCGQAEYLPLGYGKLEYILLGQVMFKEYVMLACVGLGYVGFYGDQPMF